MIAPVESTRTGNTIRVVFDNGHSIELPCPAALIGNPINRMITRGRILDCPEEYVADLQEMLAALDPSGSFGCQPGWYGLTARWWRQAKRIDPSCTVAVVKQKVGELRITPGQTRDNRARAWIGMASGWARKQSRFTCEWCAGATCEPAGVGSPSRLCGDCRDFGQRWDEAWREADA